MSSIEAAKHEPTTQFELSRAWEAGWDARVAFLESDLGLSDAQVRRIQAQVYEEIADRIASWTFPQGSDALAPICLLVAELRRGPD